MEFDPNATPIIPGQSPVGPEKKEGTDHISDLPPELRAKIFEEMSQREASGAHGTSRVLKGSVVDKTRREEHKALNEGLNDLIRRVPVEKKEVADALRKILTANPIRDAESIRQIRNESNFLQESISKTLSSLTSDEFTTLLSQLGEKTKNNKIINKSLTSAQAEFKTRAEWGKLQARAGQITTRADGISLLNEYARVDRSLSKGVELGKLVANPNAKAGYLRQLGIAYEEANNHEQLFEVIKVSDPITQGSALGDLKRITESDPALRAKYKDEINQLAHNDPNFQGLAQRARRYF